MTAEPFSNIPELRKLVLELQTQKVKLKALGNFSESGRFKHTAFLKMLNICLKQNFPSQEEQEFIDYLLSQYAIRFLDWAHKSKWVKEQIAEMKGELALNQPTLFDMAAFEKKRMFPVAAQVGHKQRQRRPSA